MEPSEVLSLAIRKEIEASELYANVAERTDNPAARTLLRELAEQEENHRHLLEHLSPEHVTAFKPPRAGQDLKITEYLEATPLGPESSLQEVVIHAMKREEQARDFYQTMAEAAENGQLKRLLEKLSTMEAGHKARLEAFYDDVFLREN